MDCQSDTFLHAFNLYKTFAARNLKCEKKLEFFAASGIITTRSLVRLNAVRNKMGHEYQFPKLTDIEVYHDLVSAFIALLQHTLTAFTAVGTYIEDSNKRVIKYAKIEYQLDVPVIEAQWNFNSIEKTIRYDMTHYKEFAFLLRVLLLMEQDDAYASNRLIKAQIKRYVL
jgi:hypothetical protein